MTSETTTGWEDWTDWVDATPQARKGNLVRETRRRHVRARCMECGLTTANPGAAASHARSARHRMQLDYRVLYEFIPVENEPWV